MKEVKVITGLSGARLDETLTRLVNEGWSIVGGGGSHWGELGDYGIVVIVQKEK